MPTSEEKAQKAAAKRARHNEGIEAAMNANWRFIDTSKECFLLDSLPAADSFLTLKIRKTTHRVSYFKIFRHFITD